MCGFSKRRNRWVSSKSHNWGMNILNTSWTGSEEGHEFRRDMRKMVIEDDADNRLCGIFGVSHAVTQCNPELWCRKWLYRA